jgi:hypothetical protein
MSGVRISPQVVLRTPRPAEFPEREKGFEPSTSTLARGNDAVSRGDLTLQITKSQPAALPGRSTRFAEVVLLVVLRDVRITRCRVAASAQSSPLD